MFRGVSNGGETAQLYTMTHRGQTLSGQIRQMRGGHATSKAKGVDQGGLRPVEGRLSRHGGFARILGRSAERDGPSTVLLTIAVLGEFQITASYSGLEGVVFAKQVHVADRPRASHARWPPPIWHPG